jgi:hypothetical protein
MEHRLELVILSERSEPKDLRLFSLTTGNWPLATVVRASQAS